MNSVIKKLKIILLYFGKKDEKQFLISLNYEKYPTQFAFDAYSGLNIWGRYFTRREEKIFVRVWTLEQKESLKETKILTRFIIDSIGIIIFIEKDSLKEYLKVWNDNFTNYPVLLISDFKFDPSIKIKNNNVNHLTLDNFDDYGKIEKIIENEIFKIKDIEVKYICSECKKELPLIEDGNFRYCFCGASGINHSNQYTRLLGNVFEKRERKDRT